MIRLAHPEMTPAEVEAASRVLRSGRLVQAEEVRAFEHELAAYLGVGHVVAVSSGTAALHLALLALGIGPGVEVIVPDFTFPATGNVVFLTGALPVLADVDPRTLCLTAEEVNRRTTSRTRAVMPVHLFGHPAAVDEITAMAEDSRITLIEDAAGALGSKCGDRFSGTFGRAGCFSFHPRKSLTTGEGGAVVTDDERIAELVRRYRNHGMVSADGVTRFELAGFNYRLTEMAAAIGRTKIPGIEASIRRKNEVAARYRELLAELEEISLPPAPSTGRHSYQAYVVRLRGPLGATGEGRARVVRALHERGVEGTLGTYAMHAQPLYQHRLGCRDRAFPNSWAAFHDTLAIPLYPELTDGEVETVVRALKESLGVARRELGDAGGRLAEARSADNRA